jgi:hypothetical protein
MQHITRQQRRWLKRQIRNGDLRAKFVAAIQWQSQVAPYRPRDLRAAIEAAMFDAFVEHGPAAFAAPRQGALAHETGHAIVLAHECISVLAVSVSTPDGQHWTGACDSEPLTVGPGADPDSNLQQARISIAGHVAERVTGTGAPASALDEYFDSCYFSKLAAAKLSCDPVMLWEQQVRRKTYQILQVNRAPFDQLVALLDATGKVEGEALQDILARVE